ncbi:MAG: cbb3-type cytochrome oxidase assembly protein CcoS [Bacteroidota bacterium]|jgi:cbb3-type cytochrome oxidase maturation protein
MSAFYLMIPVSLLLAGLFLLGFLRSVSKGQYDDTTSPAVRALDDGTTDSERNHEPKSRLEP